MQLKQGDVLTINDGGDLHLICRARDGVSLYAVRLSAGFHLTTEWTGLQINVIEQYATVLFNLNEVLATALGGEYSL